MRVDLVVSRRAAEDFAHWSRSCRERTATADSCLTAALSLGYGLTWLYFTECFDIFLLTFLRISRLTTVHSSSRFGLIRNLKECCFNWAAAWRQNKTPQLLRENSLSVLRHGTVLGGFKTLCYKWIEQGWLQPCNSTKWGITFSDR